MDLDYLHIDLKSLDYGRTERTLSLDDTYFEAIDAPEVRRGNLSVRLAIDRTSQDAFLLDFHITGTVTVSCDRCLDDMKLPIEAQERMEAKFGEESSEDDACVTVAEDEGILDVAWLIYELTALAIPVRHVHAPGKCNPAMIRVLEEHSAVRSGEGDEKATDPRWAALEQLKKKN